MSADTPRRLGRGLEALISTAKQQREAPPPTERSKADLQRLPIQAIQPNPFQPRRSFTTDELSELENSLRTNGLLQPITVRARPNGEYELVAGERRLRAAAHLGWTEIPALIRDFDDQAMLTLALVENLQRANLNPLEEAEGYRRLIDEFRLTQQDVADAVGKDRTTITNLLRVLSLPTAVLQMLETGLISTGHARALLVLKEERSQVELAKEIVARQLSVREVERRARDFGKTSAPAAPATARGSATKPSPSTASDPTTRHIEDRLRKQLQTDVQIQRLGSERGVIRISFYSADDLDRLLDSVLGKTRSDFE